MVMVGQQKREMTAVTILILIDGFLQSEWEGLPKGVKYSHNPYFNRWFSAIMVSSKPKTKINMSQSLF